ncbi:MAG: PD-(D/E)XK nuclease family protein [Bacteroidaceae bacterium]|nr:PD-(D/E)XK nuclease family protein [Bacteroidaceae bacterium]
METFLNIVAKDLYAKCGSGETGLADVTVVFPNRRARLFFDDSIAMCSTQPVWSPQYTTIEELFRSLTDLRLADRIEMVTLLHRIYTDELKSDESLDSFWSWGELMLADFDDIDRNMADAGQLFSLLSDQREMSDTSFLTDEQREAIEQFFGEMKNSRPTELRARYQTVWNVLGRIYSRFVELLSERGIGYNGLIQRRVIESLDTGRLTARRYVFVGFNSLDKAEKALFHAIQGTGKAMFYWDYDPAYTDSSIRHEAGRFLRGNLKDFPNELPTETFRNLQKARLTIVETSTDNAQARYIPQWIESLETDGRNGRETAIVLADESLLQPVLHSIPQDDVPNVNITMGYPLTETSLYNLVTALLDMQRLAARNRGGYSIQSISRVLGNPMTVALSPDALTILEELRKNRRMFPDTTALTAHRQLSVLFSPATDNLQLLQYLLTVLKSLVPVIREREDDTLFQPLNQEALYRIFTQINRLHSLAVQGNLELQTETLCRLIRSILSSTTVPFHGEPAVGMQVMGLIETRNLDFRNVLLLSAQEGTLPKTGQNASFIPYNIRVAFGLTTMQDKSAVSSYNFHHLIQRAENVTMVYNGNADAPGIGKGQISRYLLQLIVSGAEINRITLKPDRSDTVTTPLTVQKTSSVLKDLRRRYDFSDNNTYLSPSALNTYMDCTLKFYLMQIAGLKKPKDTDTDIGYDMFGTLFHKSAELTYDYLASKNADHTITSMEIESLLKDRTRLESFVQQAFHDEYFDRKEVSKDDYSGTQIISFEVILKYLRQILRMDMELYAPFRYIAGESDEYKHYVPVPDPLEAGSSIQVRIKGIIDRMDCKDGILRIVDYKTGKDKGTPATIENLFPPTNYRNRKSQAFQIFYYAYIISHQPEFSKYRLAPTLIYTRSSSKPTADDIYYRIGNDVLTDFIGQCGQEFEEKLIGLISGIFNPDIPFEPTENKETCRNCDFSQLCGRN